MDERQVRDTICDALGTIDGFLFVADQRVDDVIPAPFVVYRDTLGHTQAGVAVAVYASTDPAPGVLATYSVQLRFRASTIDQINDAAARAYPTLAGLNRAHGINHVRRLNWMPLGLDANGNPERTDNYTITIEE